MKTRTRELFKSYCKDWTLVVIVLVAFSIVDQLEPFHRQFSVRDITIQHPFAKQETVPVWLLLVSLFGTQGRFTMSLPRALALAGTIGKT